MGIRPRFDANRDFVAAREFTFAGVDYEEGNAFPKKDVDIRRVAAMYEARAINMVDLPDPAETKGVTFKETGGGWYEISAPWLEEPLKSKGKAKTDETVKEMRDAGEPASHHGYALVEGENGWWKIIRLEDEFEVKVRGEDNARSDVAALRAGGTLPDKEFKSVEVDPVTVTRLDDDDEFEITVEGSEQKEIVVGAEAAQARADEIRAALKVPPADEEEGGDKDDATEQ